MTDLSNLVKPLVEALEAMVEEQVDYMTRNQLGDPEKQHTVKMARAALAPFKEGAVPAPDKAGGHDWPTGLIDQICFATDCRPSEARAALASLKGGA